ncbi:MAG: YjbQ family protein, partial [Planctomycetes bacterium]|nr:YjbQ family protein [Planctomycetota bacterium]
MVIHDEITLSTRGHRDIHDLTGEVQQIVEKSGVRSGVVHLFNIGSTAALGTIEF